MSEQKWCPKKNGCIAHCQRYGQNNIIMKKEPKPAGADGSSSLMWPPCSCQCCPGAGHSGLGRGSLPPRGSSLGIQAKRCLCRSKRGNSSGNSSLSSWEPSCWEAALSRRVDSQVSLSGSMSWGSWGAGQGSWGAAGRTDSRSGRRS